ncbi:M48 family metallopeptidase [Hyphococcus flavus]|uniref:M48 family metallopeptidase n=1 Tax=Hyphococcus flavus TaxID=1866326 RepID=A0AAF0CI45_9PROT|nr:M48 family metallopeptidase [Hyphococcus flavus]WDI32502.1 M48 family metallopeptidase [Hyphococcus flavus]
MSEKYRVLDHKVTMSRRAFAKAAAAGSIVVLAPGCTTVSQAFTPSADQMAQLAGSAWADLKAQQPTTNDPKYTSRVRRVMPRIISAANENPAGWEVEVFASDDLNAFALPGGKIGFYTGILDIMENDSQIATVMGHEVAHVKFNHAGQRYGRTAAAQAGLGVAQVVIGGDSQASQMALGALGLGAQYGVILPFSRQHELEADRYGLRYMHRANYDVNEAVRFWEGMSAQKSGQPPELLSTHPNDSTRISQLKQEIAVLKGGA